MAAPRTSTQETSAVADCKPLTGREQLAHLADDITCHMWASAFFNAVSGFITEFITRNGEPPFIIPQFEYVSAALALETIVNASQQKKVTAWLLERRITEAEEGHWRKYINNDSPVPLPTRDKEDKTRAEFLAFTQHLQYKMTKKLTLLSDPQLITAP
ncbi:hypothetical protein SCHPADRAFT_830207 [Schizopora paradoxa]|uniref:Alpha-type protein kinase domain-containing protein n=1 Tax=Schizopora paradoxa TaxID=27342 RepID=A0A0H2S4Y2_9AGAM|nr:hypothetical protein SCHPADRAFT_830207 [Schizopora paradoxa]